MGKDGTFNFFEEASRMDTGIVGTTIDPTDKLQKEILSKVPNLPEEEDLEDEEREEEITDTVIEEDQEEITEEVEELEDEEQVFEVFATGLVNAGILNPREDAEYPPTEEGIQMLTEHTIEDRVNEIKNELNSIVLNPITNATLGDLLKFQEDGGNLKDFFSTAVDVVDYSEIDLEDEDNQINLIADKARLEGLEDSEIEELIEDHKVAGTLARQAKIAHRILAKNQQVEFENLKKEQELKREKQEEVNKLRIEEFKSKVYSLPSIGSIQLTEKEKGKFYDYLTKPVKKSTSGELLTQFEIDNDAENKRLEMAYVMFKGGIGSIENKVKTEASGNLKMALSKTKDSMLSRNSQSTPSEETQFKNKKSKEIFVPEFQLFNQ